MKIIDTEAIGADFMRIFLSFIPDVMTGFDEALMNYFFLLDYTSFLKQRVRPFSNSVNPGVVN